MAILKLSGLLTNITGKLGGSYFSKKKGSVTMNRCGSKLTKADSGRQSLQLVQNQLGGVAGAWGALNPEDKLSWQSFASTLTYYNKANEPYTPSAYEVFMSCNLNRATMGLGQLDNPVVSTGDVVIDQLSINWDVSNNLKLNYGGTTTTNNGIIVFASAPQSKGVAYPKGGYKMIYNMDVITNGATDLTDDYTNVFGYAPPSGVIFFKILTIVEDSGIQNGSKLTKADSGFA